jgi:hypothetical protein
MEETRSSETSLHNKPTLHHKKTAYFIVNTMKTSDPTFPDFKVAPLGNDTILATSVKLLEVFLETTFQ